MSGFVPHLLGNCPPPLGEEPSDQEHPQDPEEMHLTFSQMLQAAMYIVLVILFFVITLLFRFATCPVLDPLDDTLPPLGEELSHPECPQGPGDTHLSGIQRVVITAIRVTDLTLGLRRIPAGFHVTVKADGAEWQTSNKFVHVDQTVVEWNEPILLPSEPSSKVRVGVYATLELGPMLGHGELLRTFEISVAELLDRSEKSNPILFQPRAGEVVSPCTSLFMTVEQQREGENDAAVLRPVTTLTSGDMRTLVLETDAGHRLLARYRRTQNSRDLEQSITHFERASGLCPVDDPCRPAALFNLATAKFVSCQTTGTYPDFDIPITLFHDALDMRPTGHLDHAITQLHLAIALLSRCAKRGSPADADAAEELLNEVLDVSPVESHVYRAALLVLETSALARSTDVNIPEVEGPIASMLPWSLDELARRVKLCLRTDDSHALDEVISCHYGALGYYRPGHDQREHLLGNLGALLLTRFQRRGSSQDINEGVELSRQLLALHSVGHPDRYRSLGNLASGLFLRFEHLDNDQDLDEANVLYMEALALLPVDHPDRSGLLNHLARHLGARFNHRGNHQDLDEAIVLASEALSLCPAGHPGRSESLNSLANQLSTRFEHRGNDQDLDKAIVLRREALPLHPVGDPVRSMSLNNLGTGLTARFRRRGNDDDLDEAILLCREALSLDNGNHRERLLSLNALGNAIFTRFKCRRDPQDLDEAILLQREALALRPVGHGSRHVPLNNLAHALSARFEHRGNNQDLDEAILLQREVLALHPVGHPLRPSSFTHLGSNLIDRFTHRANDQDLDEAMVLCSKALALCPVGHAGRPMSLVNLGAVLHARFQHRGNAHDLNESIENLRCALTLLTQHDPRQLTVHSSLASAHIERSGLDGIGQDTDNLNAIIHHLKAAANVVSGDLPSRLVASMRWVLHAEEHTHDTELEAYTTFMERLDAYMCTTAPVSSRHNVTKGFPSRLAVNAASCALRRGDVCRAVELLEQGKTLIWTQMARLRTPLDTLQEHGDHAAALMKKFQDLSSLLDQPPVKHLEGTSIVDVEAEATRHRRLVENWNTALEDVRKIEGFERFLLAPLFSELQDAAHDGPIIILIASKSSCDAIIVPHKETPVSVGLVINIEKLRRLVYALQRTVHNEEEKQAKLIQALRELWVEVVHPVVEHLDKVAKPGSRIWWCPTSFFNFLPLHAAGEYRPKGTNLSQLYISSYTPSLTALIKARKRRDKSLLVSFAAIGQNHPPEHKHPLACVESELDLVQSLLPPSPTISFTKVTSADSTKSTALRTLRDNHWVHFACHGTQNLVEPFKSALLMRDEQLQLQDISYADLSRHEFAFLSACQTAVGDFETPDEAIHLAAGLQFSGVKSVIGTFWNVDDITVQRLVEAFYKEFCGNGKMNSKRAARALHKAVQSLKDLPLDQRIVFMHIGI